MPMPQSTSIAQYCGCSALYSLRPLLAGGNLSRRVLYVWQNPLPYRYLDNAIILMGCAVTTTPTGYPLESAVSIYADAGWGGLYLMRVIIYRYQVHSVREIQGA